ncbi:MAG: hypothetical protein A2020_11665 [Lentisphaerae bacterium GWF2_45_14]|nr:MAG: hypothetical protein A2020_11665 [Lentisphaerae bacterium GWF2_45_14]
MKKTQFRESLLTFGIILCAAVWSASKNISRPLWFDEVITVTGFTLNLDFSQIYFKYNIPNNHILFTYLLKFFINAWSEFLSVFEWTFRLPSLALSIISLWTLYRFTRTRASRETALAASLLFALSMPFAIYSVAIRGYIMSFLFVLLAFIFCDKALRRKKKTAFILYFISSLAAVGTIPSNIIPLVLIPFIAARYCKIRELLTPGFIAALLIPLFSILIFYLPIHEKFMANMNLKEGWSNHSAAISCIYAAFIVSFLPLIILAIPAIIKRETIRIDRLARLAIFFAPAAVILISSPAPFPRVFFPLLALWIPVAAWTASPLIRKLLRKFKDDSRLLIAVAVSALWALSCLGAKNNLSVWTARDHGLDDYFSPYYTQKDFQPFEAGKTIKQMSEGKSVPVFVSFDADPYAFGFYWSVLKMPDSLFLFDGPKLKTLSIKRPFSPKTFIVVKDENDFKRVLKRFPCKDFRVIDAGKYQKIYEVIPE